MKTCAKCNQLKSFDQFSKHPKTQYQHWCKACCSLHRKVRLQEPAYKALRNLEIREYHRNNVLSATKHTMRRLVRRTMKKTSASQALLGYSAQELKTHLENQFLPGMTWENRSTWHIDHIIPVADFLNRGINNPNIVNSLSNLRPLWANDNLTKGAKIK